MADALLNNQASHPVRLTFEVKYSNPAGRTGRVRWKVENRPGEATPKTWMDSGAFVGSHNGFLPWAFPMDASEN